MKDDQRIKVLEEELKVLKNEVHAVLLDLREQYLNLQNPFNQSFVPSAGSQIKGMQEENAEIEATAEVNEVNAPTDVKTEENQIHLLQSPKPSKEENKSKPKAQAEAAESQMRDKADAESYRALSRRDKTCLWPRSETDGEEIFEEPLPKSAPFNKRQKEQEFIAQSGKVDLVVIAGLTQWLDQTTAKLGKERTEVLVEISFAMGRLSKNLKDTLIRMIRLSHHESASGQSINASDYLAILAQLDNLLSGSKQQDNALLSILSMMKDARNG
jgi:hypothetical protein